jgi:hypothetical protein
VVKYGGKGIEWRTKWKVMGYIWHGPNENIVGRMCKN